MTTDGVRHYEICLSGEKKINLEIIGEQYDFFVIEGNGRTMPKKMGWVPDRLNYTMLKSLYPRKMRVD